MRNIMLIWCWEELGAGGKGDDRGWDGWMASLTRWTWVWVNSRSWWWMRGPGVLRFMGLQRVGNDWATELTWTECNLLRNNHFICFITEVGVLHQFIIFNLFLSVNHLNNRISCILILDLSVFQEPVKAQA